MCGPSTARPQILYPVMCEYGYRLRLEQFTLASGTLKRRTVCRIAPWLCMVERRKSAAAMAVSKYF